MSGTEALHSFWFDRFQVRRAPEGKLQFMDRLNPPAKLLDAARFNGLQGVGLARAYFKEGFVPPVLGPVGREVGAAVSDEHDHMFWQFPCRTEGAAWMAHCTQNSPALRGDELHVYLGLPWATWIDIARKNAWGAYGTTSMQHQVQMLAVRIAGYRNALAGIGVKLRVHTVCQHICWRDMGATWARLGVTDAWLSHLPAAGLHNDEQGFAVHPWSLYAVNVRDNARRAGIIEGRDPTTKKILASFIGAHAEHYLSDVRLRLQTLANAPRFVVQLTDKWHFEDVVYAHQVGKRPISPATSGTTAVQRYNEVLSDSVFSLCPAGAGPNTLRLWESLAVGAIPVLLGPIAAMPCGGNLPAIDWARIVMRVDDEQISELPRILSAVPASRLSEMQRLGMEAYALVEKQRCY